MKSTSSRLAWAVAGVLAVAMAAPATAQQEEQTASQEVREQVAKQVRNEGASEALQVRDRQQQQVGERPYGEPLMSAEERNQFREQLQATQDPQARQQLTEQHRKAMQDRAKQRGVALSADGNEILPGDRQRRQDQDRLQDKSGAGDMQRDRQRDRDMVHPPGMGGAGGPGRGGGVGGGSGGGGRGGRG
jgi:hypothetical protein